MTEETILSAPGRSRTDDDAAEPERDEHPDRVPRVLIVDDHASFGSIARQVLTADGFLVVGEAVSGTEAIRACGELRPALVLLDVQLPDIDGLVVAAALATRVAPPAVVLVSSRSRADYGFRTEDRQAHGYMALTASEAGGFSGARAAALALAAADPLAAEAFFAETAALLRRAVDQLADGPWEQKHALLVELGRHQQRAGDLRGWSESVEASLELAVAHDDWAAGGHALSSMLDGGTPWSWLSYGHVRPRPVELLTQLVALVPSDSGSCANSWEAARVRCLATAVLAAELYFTRDTERCTALSRAALELARGIDDSALFATVVALSEMAVWSSGDGPHERIGLRREAIARGLAPAQEAAALYRNAVDLYQVVQVESAEADLRRCADLVSVHRTPGWQIAFGHLRASRLVTTGDLDAGEQLALRTETAHRRTTMGAADVIVSGLLLSIRLEQGRLADAQPALRQALADSRMPIQGDALAFVLAHTGRHDDARAALVGGDPSGELPDDGLLTGRLALRSFAWYDLFRADRPVPRFEAQAIRERLLPSAGQVVMYCGGIGVWGAVDLFLGIAALLVGDREAAVEALQKAVEVNDAAGITAWGARSRRLLARTLGKGNQLDEATACYADRLTVVADAAVAAAGMPATAGSV